MSRFDALIDRRGTGSNKWSRYAPDVLPLWVADMDFAVPDCVAEAVAARAAHAVYGYAAPQASLRAVIVADLAARYGWRVAPEEIVILPGVEPGFNMALAAFLQAGDGVALHTPAYRPMRRAPGFWGLTRHDIPLVEADGRWQADPAQEAAAIAASRALLLCNPQNPLGKVFTRAELAAMAEAALAAGTLIISDEIHADLVYDGRAHVPIATLSPEVARRTITLMSPGKTYNISGLKVAFAVVPDTDLRARFDQHRLGMVDSVNAFGLAAMEAAYAHGGAWRDELVGYLAGNRDVLARAVAAQLPGVRMAAPEGTFLAWLDCRAAAINGSAQAHFLEHARVALSAGEEFSDAGAGFVRLNFGCPRATLVAAIARMAASL